ncbi:hypothetical protein CcI156_09220 [Frankia sp. CcI156]|nr:hypothetical protein Manayef4_09000 [Frankia sp. CgIM4]OHV56291.1 hypothetical protein CgIS1_09255 [Frankia sp. CgIS1]ONH26852.1 hypothetical protein CcI156_09220 [Frankia sp. CcI156]
MRHIVTPAPGPIPASFLERVTRNLADRDRAAGVFAGQDPPGTSASCTELIALCTGPTTFPPNPA